MQKKNGKLDNNKGIALITLVVAVLMMIIISSIIIFNTTNHLKINNLNNMYNDIRVLNEQVFLYYSKYNELPIISDEYENELDFKILGKYELNKFHIIDIDKIDRNIKTNLKYGADYYNKNYAGTNIYIINTATHQIFYAQGITVDDITYYTIPGESDKYQNISVDEIIANPPKLENDLKSIIYDEQSGIVPVSNYDKIWYDYSENTDLSKWARAEITDTDIYVWVPRYAYNTETNEIVFLKGITNNPIQEKDITGDKWTIPDAFENKEKEQLTGIWLSLGDNYKKINSKVDLIETVYGLTGKDNTKGATNTSITEAEYTYYNPVIPVGFKTVQTKGASWKSTNGIQVDGWNDGLVIEDEDGNQFVWVPVDGTNVRYEKWLATTNDWVKSLDELSDDIEAFPENIIEYDKIQINKYGGFYIARYEAGIPENMTNAINISNANARNVNGIPVSKKNQVPWNWIDYTTAKSNAKKMYNNKFVKSGIITGTQWDTVMKWIEITTNLSVQTVDCKNWGNFLNAEISKVTEYSTDYGATWIKTEFSTKKSGQQWLLKTGHTEYSKVKNIYDLGGNVWEKTNEFVSSKIIPRGGGLNNNTPGRTTAIRGGDPIDNKGNNLGFRCALYIQ